MEKRYEFLVDIIRKHGLFKGVEVGVGSGVTSAYILANVPELHLTAVDSFPLMGKSTRERDTIKRQFTRKIQSFPDRAVFLNFDSSKAAIKVPDESFDFVFIDANHGYKFVRNDIKLWYPKIKKGGLVSGHDYKHPKCPGVKKAVDEFFGKDNIKTSCDYVWYYWK